MEFLLAMGYVIKNYFTFCSIVGVLGSGLVIQFFYYTYINISLRSLHLQCPAFKYAAKDTSEILTYSGNVILFAIKNA